MAEESIKRIFLMVPIEEMDSVRTPPLKTVAGRGIALQQHFDVDINHIRIFWNDTAVRQAQSVASWSLAQAQYMTGVLTSAPCPFPGLPDRAFPVRLWLT